MNCPARHNLHEPHTYSERLAVTRDSRVEVVGHDSWNPWIQPIGEFLYLISKLEVFGLGFRISTTGGNMSTRPRNADARRIQVPERAFDARQYNSSLPRPQI